MNAEFEKQFVKRFVIKSKQPRTLDELSNPKKRERVTSHLAFHLDRNLFFHCAASDPTEICRILKAEGAPDMCYILSRFAENDGRELPLLEGLQMLDYELEILVSLPGKLAFFRETPTQSYVLKAN